jgi:hypothetical protein
VITIGFTKSGQEPVWVFRLFDESRMCLLGEIFLGSFQNAFPQEIEAASAIHLSLQKFQAMHLALGLAIAPLQGEASFHRLVIFP